MCINGLFGEESTLDVFRLISCIHDAVVKIMRNTRTAYLLIPRPCGGILLLTRQICEAYRYSLKAMTG